MSEVKYQGSIDLSVKNNSHTMAYEMIDRVANGKLLNVLEVGCASGYFGSAIKAAGHQVWGIEPDKTAAAIASERLDYVFVGVVEDFIRNHSDKKFDVISFGDVLEHLSDPSEVLEQCHGLLVEGGAIVASVPNVSHVAVRGMLLEGNWDYAELGILDKTHLRFFTRKTIQKLFCDCGLKVVDISAVTLTPGQTIRLCEMNVSERAVRTADAFAVDESKYDFQYVLLGVPITAKAGCGREYLLSKPKISVLGIANAIESSHAQVRMIEPLKAWASHCNGNVDFVSVTDCQESHIGHADVVVIQRHVDPAVVRLVKMAKELGKKIIYETDDYLLELPEHLMHHEASLVHHHNHLEHILPQVDCITVTTERLAKRYAHFGRNIEVVPNCIVGNDLPSATTESWKDGVANLIVASSDKILVDFLLPAIAVLIQRKDIDVKVTVIGPPGDAFDAAGIKVDRVPNMDYPAFKAFIRTIGNPIGIIPLDDSLFSSCKTAIKYFDYSMAGIPVVCSNVPPYSDVIQSGEHGLLTENDTQSWVNASMQLINDVSLRTKLVRNAQTLITSHHGVASAVGRLDYVINKVVSEESHQHEESETLSSTSLALNSLKFYRAHLFNRSSYLFAIKLIRRDGLRALLKRLTF